MTLGKAAQLGVADPAGLALCTRRGRKPARQRPEAQSRVTHACPGPPACATSIQRAQLSGVAYRANRSAAHFGTGCS